MWALLCLHMYSAKQRSSTCSFSKNLPTWKMVPGKHQLLDERRVYPNYLGRDRTERYDFLSQFFYFILLFSSLLKKERREKENEVKLWYKVIPFCSIWGGPHILWRVTWGNTNCQMRGVFIKTIWGGPRIIWGVTWETPTARWEACASKLLGKDPA